MMSFTEQLLLLAGRFTEHTGMSLSTLSTKLFNGGGRLSSIAAGGDLNTRSFESAVAWLSENWPADLAWPNGVARPADIEAVQ